MISCSFVEVEYHVVVITSCEFQWLLSLFHDLQITHPQPTNMFCDNKATLHITTNLVFHEHTKNIEVDCHVVCERIQVGLVCIAYVHTKKQLDDVFTKALGAILFIP